MGHLGQERAPIYEALEVFRGERIVPFVAGHSGISGEDFQDLMLRKDDMAADVGSVIYGEEAVELGLIDRIGGLSDALECLYGMVEEKK